MISLGEEKPVCLWSQLRGRQNWIRVTQKTQTKGLVMSRYVHVISWKSRRIIQCLQEFAVTEDSLIQFWLHSFCSQKRLPVQRSRVRRASKMFVMWYSQNDEAIKDSDSIRTEMQSPSWQKCKIVEVPTRFCDVDNKDSGANEVLLFFCSPTAFSEPKLYQAIRR
jgi:hypothetical protein